MRDHACQHCGRSDLTIQARQLCSKCYVEPGIREQYAKLKTKPPPPTQPELTEAELDAMIAEQMANLPDWWHEDTGGVQGPAKPHNDRHQMRGKDRKHVRLTAEIVEMIRKRARSGESCASIARELGITRANVSLIVNRKSWRDVA